jgi:hypothetical protein
VGGRAGLMRLSERRTEEPLVLCRTAPANCPCPIR